MIQYELRKCSIEIPYKKRKQIMEGCTGLSLCQETELILTTMVKEEACDALKLYDTEVEKLSGSAGTYFMITEYYVEEVSLDSEGEVVSYATLEWSKLEVEKLEELD